MRSATANDYWRKLYKTQKYKYIINELNFNGAYGLQSVTLNKGVYAICGLNGAGKSTVISFLKDIIGIEISEQDESKIDGKIVSAKLYGYDDVVFQNVADSRLSDYFNQSDLGVFLDYRQSLDVLDYFIKQTNLDEFLEQFETNKLSDEITQEISYIVGKHYDECIIIEVEDGDIYRPFFIVKSKGVEYNSLFMGIGEHFLFFLFWALEKIQESKIVLIEEPETFISINSQINLMNYIAKKASEFGVSVILTTHSPFIIKNIRRENICLVSRYSTHAGITYPTVHNQTLIKLGLDMPKKGIMYFEDDVAQIFVECLIQYSNTFFIFNDYNFEIVNGEAEITKRLKYPLTDKFTYDIIGLYDGDMISIVEKQKDEIKCKYLFLPNEIGIEISYKDMLYHDVEKFIQKTGIENSIVIETISSVAGDECHDWLINLAKRLGFSKHQLVGILTEMWLEDGQNIIKTNEFIRQLLELCYKE